MVSQTSALDATRANESSKTFLSTDDRPTVAGSVPDLLANTLREVPPPLLPEFTRLPRPRERDPITGASRTWLIQTNDRLSADRRFLFRVRQRGKIRGTCFINVAKLLAVLRDAEADDLKQLDQKEHAPS